VIAFDAAELDLIRTSLRQVLDTTTPAELPGALLAQGWADLVATDPAAAITALSEQAGRARSVAPIADLAMLHGAGLVADATTAVLVDGHALAGAERATRFVLVDEQGIVSVGADSVELTPAGGFDPALGLSRATVGNTKGDRIGDASAATSAIAAGRRALASQMVGSVEQMLTDTLAYVTERHQFGRSIGSFQTVKHRLAEVKVAVTAAQATTATAWESATTVAGSTLAMAAKALAGRAHELASTHCFQVHGGIAFTVEHGFHQWVRRGLLLDHLLGNHRSLTGEVGRAVIAAGGPLRLPPLTVPQ
jgi:alkylation response protein AidB-like acyl-CoA dehydrogenase